MRRTVHSVIKKYLSKHIAATRSNNKWTKRKMSEELDMDDRSYADIEKGVSACSTVTFILYLLFVLNQQEQSQLLHDLREQILKLWDQAA